MGEKRLKKSKKKKKRTNKKRIEVGKLNTLIYQRPLK